MNANEILKFISYVVLQCKGSGTHIRTTAEFVSFQFVNNLLQSHFFLKKKKMPTNYLMLLVFSSVAAHVRSHVDFEF